MRVAISGTHSQGKSTFCRDFLSCHPEYKFEDEPYRAIKDKHEILFGDHQTQHHVNLQLEHCIRQVKKYQQGDCVIFDRPPSDYIPYSDYTAQNARTDIDSNYVRSLYDKVKPVMSLLDLIVFIPMTDEYKIELEDDGHRPIDDFYRNWVDEAFKAMYRENYHQILPSDKPPCVVEITGPREQRVTQLKRIIEHLRHNK